MAEPSSSKNWRKSITKIFSNGFQPENDEIEVDPEQRAQTVMYNAQPFYKKYFIEFILGSYLLSMYFRDNAVEFIMDKKMCNYDYWCQTKWETRRVTILPWVLRSILGIISAAVAGQYMIRYGFRKPLVAALIGGIISSFLQALTMTSTYIPAFVSIFAEIPAAITGGRVLITAFAYVHIARTVPKNNVVQRIMVIILFVSLPNAVLGELGVFPLGMLATTIIAVVLSIIPATLAFLFLEEDDINEEHLKESWKTAIGHSVKDSVGHFKSLLTKKRPHNEQQQILFLIACFFCAHVGSQDAGLLNFYLSRSNYVFYVEPLLVSGIWKIFSFLITAYATHCVLSRRMVGLHYAHVIAAGAICFVAKYIVLSISPFSWIFVFMQMLVGSPAFVTIIFLRGYLTELVIEDKPGVVMSLMVLLSSIEYFLPWLAEFLAMRFLLLTTSIFSGFVFLVIAGIYFLLAVLSIVCWKSYKQGIAAQTATI